MRRRECAKLLLGVVGGVLTSNVSLAAPAQRQAPRVRETILDVLRRIETNLMHSSYSHSTAVDEARGSYVFDCSGMASWVLRRGARKAHAAVLYRVQKGRPLARDFYHHIARLSPDKEAYGWRRVFRVADAVPGDVIAWLKPDVLRSPNTGHVAFLVEAPRPLDEVPNAFLVRIADASRYRHQDDTREESGRTGYGVGTILVLADPDSGAPTAYGWFGRYSRYILPARMAIGRPTS
jgi:hypothetical protein